MAAARWVLQSVMDTVPVEVWQWDRLPAIVGAKERAFIDALGRWEDSGTQEDYDAARAAGEALKRAWERAGELWRIQQRSGGAR